MDGSDDLKFNDHAFDGEQTFDDQLFNEAFNTIFSPVLNNADLQLQGLDGVNSLNDQAAGIPFNAELQNHSALASNHGAPTSTVAQGEQFAVNGSGTEWVPASAVPLAYQHDGSADAGSQEQIMQSGDVNMNSYYPIQDTAIGGMNQVQLNGAHVAGSVATHAHPSPSNDSVTLAEDKDEEYESGIDDEDDGDYEEEQSKSDDEVKYEDDDAADEEEDAAKQEGESKRNGYSMKRVLIRWNAAQDQLMLLALEYECNKLGIVLPWEAVAKHFHDAGTKEAPIQHLSKLRRARVYWGLPIPPELVNKARRTERKSGDDKYLSRPVNQKLQGIYHTLVCHPKGDNYLSQDPGRHGPRYTAPTYPAVPGSAATRARAAAAAPAVAPTPRSTSTLASANQSVDTPTQPRKRGRPRKDKSAVKVDASDLEATEANSPVKTRRTPATRKQTAAQKSAANGSPAKPAGVQKAKKPRAATVLKHRLSVRTSTSSMHDSNASDDDETGTLKVESNQSEGAAAYATQPEVAAAPATQQQITHPALNMAFSGPEMLADNFANVSQNGYGTVDTSSNSSMPVNTSFSSNASTVPNTPQNTPSRGLGMPNNMPNILHGSLAQANANTVAYQSNFNNGGFQTNHGNGGIPLASFHPGGHSRPIHAANGFVYPGNFPQDFALPQQNGFLLDNPYAQQNLLSQQGGVPQQNYFQTQPYMAQQFGYGNLQQQQPMNNSMPIPMNEPFNVNLQGRGMINEPFDLQQNITVFDEQLYQPANFTSDNYIAVGTSNANNGQAQQTVQASETKTEDTTNDADTGKPFESELLKHLTS